MTGGPRFDLVAQILRQMAAARPDASLPEAWLTALATAGVHPASLLLCCQGRNIALIEPLRRALGAAQLTFEVLPAVSYDTIVAWSPLTYAHEIDFWNLRTLADPRLPDHLLAIRGLTILGDARLRALGCGWTLVGDLRLLDLAGLPALPEGLEVFGDLILGGLPELRTLGGETRIHGNLTIADCPALEGLPADLEVAGAIWMDARGPRFQGCDAIPAGRILCPWPGIAPKPCPIAHFPEGALELACQ